MTTRPRPTIVDVARHAGVALGTASNVLNDRGNVSPERAARVRAAMATLGYVPDGVAQSLRRQRSRVVGICVPSTSSAYFAALQDAFEDMAAQKGYELMQVLSRGDAALELRRVEALLSRRVDGVILIPATPPEATFAAIARSRVPAVIVDRPAADTRFDYVTIDERAAMREATRHLLALGHRRLLFVVRWPALVTTRERIAGYRAALKGTGADGTVLARDADDAVFARDLRAALTGPGRATAVIASNSALALPLLAAARALRIAMPGALSVLVFDEPDWAAVVDPPLAVVRHPTAQMARTAWELLIRRIDAPRARPQRVVFDATLVPGPSAAAPRVG
ncbi:MAG: LacI family DNA-binding transcriptional regulator [Proteobacteria bacterium]|nr:LacI family DNA-binding transcriptional regulator [Pseudomonadota bacterium]